MSDFEDLEIYKQAYRLAVEIYKLTKNSKNSDLVRETSRSARSIATNIAEGFSRRSDKKILGYHLGVAMGEANEMTVHLSFLKDFGDMDEKHFLNLKNEYIILAKRINSFRTTNKGFCS